VKQTTVGAALLAGASAGTFPAAAAAGPTDAGKRIVAALGSVFIPSKPGDPGYKELESHGITGYVMESFPAEALDVFNGIAQQFFEGKSFLDLDGTQREQYLALIADGSRIADADQRARLQRFYRSARARILSVYYKNYPFHEAKRNAEGEPILQPGDTHQITSPNVWKDKKIVTGWDVAGYKGPLGWEEEEQVRAKAKKTADHWVDGDVVKLENSRPPAAAAVKTSEGHDYYDVIVLGGGTAGCIVAGRLAERGMNPKTGDRLRVAMIEGGDDWTIRDPGIKPGYGYPIRRRMLTNIPDSVGPEGSPGPGYRWPYDPAGTVEENLRLVGGCILHFGGQLWIPGDEDFHFYRETTGVDWDEAKFGNAIEEVRDLIFTMSPPDAWWSKGNHIWADAGRALGFEMHPNVIAYRNIFLGSSMPTDMNRYDSKGTTLPWAYIGMNNGLKIIPNAEVEKILIEKVPGGRPVATGAMYKDKAGAMHEVRAARVIVACGSRWTPLLLYRSGYGPRDFLGDKLLVENINVGRHLSGDSDFVSSAYLAEPISAEGRQADIPRECGPWASTKPRPWGELDIRIHSGDPDRFPDNVALGTYAPEFGWDHKEYMRNGAGVRRVMTWRCHLGAIPWSWRVQPDGTIVRTELDTARFEATVKDASEIIRAWHGKLAIKPVKVDLRTFSRPTDAVRPQHCVGTTRAGMNPETSVCTPDFDCHDIDHLLFTSTSTIPKTFFWSAGPAAVNAAYAWRRMIANHFSSGCSTKGFA